MGQRQPCLLRFTKVASRQYMQRPMCVCVSILLACTETASSIPQVCKRCTVLRGILTVWILQSDLPHADHPSSLMDVFGSQFRIHLFSGRRIPKQHRAHNRLRVPKSLASPSAAAIAPEWRIGDQGIEFHSCYMRSTPHQLLDLAIYYYTSTTVGVTNPWVACSQTMFQ